AIDITGNNLANVDTVAYKAQRVTFRDLFNQTISFGVAPQGNLGGIDPQQLGLGVQIGDTSRNFAQGALKTTGVKTDIALEGDGFFIVKDNDGSLLFTRDGSFSLNPQNLYHDPVTGRIVQGLMADFKTFEITQGGPLKDIEIPVGKLSIANQTSQIKLAGNFNGGGEIADSGTLIESGVFIDKSTTTPATLATLLTDLQRQGPGGPVDLNLAVGDIIELRAVKGNRTINSRFQVSSAPPTPGIDATGTTLQDLIEFLRASLGINNNITGMYSAPVVNGAIAPGETINVTSYTADATIDFKALGVEPGDFMRIESGPGAGQVARIASIGPTNNILNFDSAFTFDPTIPLPSVGDRWVIQERARVSLGIGANPVTNPNLEDTNSAAGKIRITGNVGSANEISNITLSKVGGDALTIFTTLKNASGESTVVNTTVYDSLGVPHLLTLTYALMSKSSLDQNRGNKLIFFAETDSNFNKDKVAGQGFIQFDTAGKFISDSPLNSIIIDLSNSGANTPLIIKADSSKLTALSNSNSDIAVTEQDGFAKGTLNDFSIGSDGIITGIFTNGITKPIAQLQIARFDNNNGLLDVGKNYFKVGPNSGAPIIGNPGSFARGIVRSGVLEEANVDMAKEFTNLIVSQRAFQANAKTITVANQILQDLISIV
ncbi:MAG: flagellar hook-basal body complex protein, partial [Planctomycetota bacterium]